MNKRIITFTMLGFLSLASFGFAVSQKPSATKAVAITGYTNHDGTTYYDGISDSLDGDDLLEALRSLNKNRRKSTVGYGSMGTTASGMFKYTDYDPNSVKYDENNQPYGTTIVSFYSGNTMTSFNREHVWPNSHGGSKVENDIHMPRPTIPSENGSRGNSFYVEGMKHSSNGWDPAMEDFGKEDYRGDSARIIFYCVVASDALSLVDLTYHQTSKKNPDNLMGKLSHMLKWNLEYPVLQREQNRNEGAEYLQGNRNPFIDHPEYACRIWGNYNDETRSVCATYGGKQINIMTGGASASDTTMLEGATKIFVAHVDNQLESDVTWTLVDAYGNAYTNNKITLSVENGQATINAVQADTAYLKAAYSYDDNGTTKTISAKIKITVQKEITLDSITVSNPKTQYYLGDRFVEPVVIAHYSDGNTEEVQETSSFSGFDSSTVGTKTITVTYLNKTTTYEITVSQRPDPVLNNISVSDPKTNYTVGDEFVKPTVIANYSDGTSRDVTNEATFSGFDSSTEGQKTIEVTYQGKMTTYQIVVSKGSYGPTNPSNGCGGNVATASIILSSLALSGIIVIVIAKIINKKKKMG